MLHVHIKLSGNVGVLTQFSVGGEFRQLKITALLESERDGSALSCAWDPGRRLGRGVKWKLNVMCGRMCNRPPSQ